MVAKVFSPNRVDIGRISPRLVESLVWEALPAMGCAQAGGATRSECKRLHPNLALMESGLALDQPWIGAASA